MQYQQIPIREFHKTNIKEINSLYSVLLRSLNNEDIMINAAKQKEFYQDFVRYMYHNSILHNNRRISNHLTPIIAHT